MSPRKIVTAAILVCLLGVGARMVYTGGLGMRLGARPASLAAPFTTEEAWVVGEVIRDIAEMAAYPESRDVAPDIQADAQQRGMYAVAIASGTPREALDLRDDLWSPMKAASR